MTFTVKKKRKNFGYLWWDLQNMNMIVSPLTNDCQSPAKPSLLLFFSSAKHPHPLVFLIFQKIYGAFTAWTSIHCTMILLNFISKRNWAKAILSSDFFFKIVGKFSLRIERNVFRDRGRVFITGYWLLYILHPRYLILFFTFLVIFVLSV